jgi:hypothetical protein
MCEKLKVLPPALSALPIEQLEAVARECGAGTADGKTIKEFLPEYIKSKGF